MTYDLLKLIYEYSNFISNLLNPKTNLILLLGKIHMKIISNKRPMGHIDHLRKRFKSINVDKEKKKNIINFMRIYWFFI